MWQILFDDDFLAWFLSLPAHVQTVILTRVRLLEQRGPRLGRPHVDTLKGSRFPNLKELRVPIGGEPWRILFAFDPRRSAILLVGGNKQRDKRWYDTMIPIAEARFQRHLDSLEP